MHRISIAGVRSATATTAEGAAATAANGKWCIRENGKYLQINWNPPSKKNEKKKIVKIIGCWIWKHVISLFLNVKYIQYFFRYLLFVVGVPFMVWSINEFCYKNCRKNSYFSILWQTMAFDIWMDFVNTKEFCLNLLWINAEFFSFNRAIWLKYALILHSFYVQKLEKIKFIHF